MALANLISTIKEKADSLAQSEEAAKQGAILPILNDLGWQVFDTTEVFPEFSISGMRVDYCLIVKHEPAVFIEAKRGGKELDDASVQEQILTYSFRQGVKLAILTDGLLWKFYLPMADGSWEKRHFFTIDLRDIQVDQAVTAFNKYLLKTAVESGDAVRNALDTQKSREKKRLIAKTLPEAWATLCAEPDDILVELLQDKVASMCGHRPDEKEAKDFIVEGAPALEPEIAERKVSVFRSEKKRISTAPLVEGRQPYEKPPIADKPVYRAVDPSVERLKFTKPIEFTFLGRKLNVHSYRDILYEVCSILKDKYPEKFESTIVQHKYFSKRQSELSSNPKQIPGMKIFVSTCWNNNNMLRIVHEAIQLFGHSPSELKIKFHPRLDSQT